MVIINLTAVFAAAIAQMVLGSLWYGPFFKKPWMRLVGLTSDRMAEMGKKGGMGKTYALATLGALVTTYVMAHFVFYVGPTTLIQALQLGFWLWLGFVATALLGQVLWLQKPWALYAIDTGYFLVAFMIESVILTFWR